MLVGDCTVGIIFCGKRGLKKRGSNANDHHFRGFHKRGYFLAFLETHFAHRICGDNGRNVLPADRNTHLRHQAAQLHIRHSSNQLIAPADTPKIVSPLRDIRASRFAIQKPVHFFFWHAVMAAGCLHRLDFALVDPLLQRRIADSEHLRRFTRREQFRWFHPRCTHIRMDASLESL
jgi:hypothetical protein